MVRERGRARGETKNARARHRPGRPPGACPFPRPPGLAARQRAFYLLRSHPRPEAGTRPTKPAGGGRLAPFPRPSDAPRPPQRCNASGPVRSLLSRSLSTFFLPPSSQEGHRAHRVRELHVRPRHGGARLLHDQQVLGGTVWRRGGEREEREKSVVFGPAGLGGAPHPNRAVGGPLRSRARLAGTPACHTPRLPGRASPRSAPNTPGPGTALGGALDGPLRARRERERERPRARTRAHPRLQG